MSSKGADATIEDNVLNDNATGIQTSDSDATLVRNTVGGGNIGIMVGAGSPTLEDNQIDGADRGLVIGFGVTPTLDGNTVCGNTTNVIVNERAEMPDISANEICEDAPAGQP
jgi:parallel beta-helix repeat protein